MTKRIHIRWALRILGAASCVVAAFLFKIGTVGEAVLPFLFFVLPVMISGIFFGRVPALISIALSNLLITYFFLPPYHTIYVHDLKQIISLGYFNLVAACIGMICASFRKVLLRVNELNITLEDRVREEVDRRTKVEQALQQSQKMEAVGQLTGGIAHDFNNLLTGVTGNLSLLQERAHHGKFNDMDRYIDAAQGAIKRAAALTHRLLAFSRRQTLDPQITDVAHLVESMTDLIQRSMGPSIIVRSSSHAGLWDIRVDQSQLENALLNLCLNARDAMVEGTIDIVMSNLSLPVATDDLTAGDYVVMSVTDSGCGMTKEIAARIFDPFFTTKPLGQGTGLGLSMIYGFARQSNGLIEVLSSEIGEGTTMRLLLPRSKDAKKLGAIPAPVIPSRSVSGKTIGLIEDDAVIRMLLNEVLTDNGYEIYEAEDAPTGATLLRSNVHFDLLITDIGLPGGMNGRQLADLARETRPDLLILFITGYAPEKTLPKGDESLEDGMHILTKPFGLDTLLAKVTGLLDEHQIKVP